MDISKIGTCHSKIEPLSERLISVKNFGLETSEDEGKPIWWYRKPTNTEEAFGLNQVGMCYKNYFGTPKKNQLTFDYYRKATESGASHGQMNMERGYLLGKGPMSDPRKSVNWLQKAAENKNSFSQWYLGLSYRSGSGISKDFHASIYWFRKALENGDRDAFFSLQETFLLESEVFII
ncbi:hypothetical protein G9A89_021751 [Geosiphon pyriformis]|nr:hypothetical protein G9A89_021751 [Geosiphon pyriformis]